MAGNVGRTIFGRTLSGLVFVQRVFIVLHQPLHHQRRVIGAELAVFARSMHIYVVNIVEHKRFGFV